MTQTIWESLKHTYQASVPYSIRLAVWRVEDIYINPYLVALSVALMVSVFIFEKVLPARMDQKFLSIGFFQDLIWFNLNFLGQLTLLVLYGNWLSLVYSRNLSFLTVQAVHAWPKVSRVILSYVLGDFLAWFHHFMRHKVKTFWAFHTIHHSQREINFFSDERFHIMEHVISSSLVFIPALMFQINFSFIPALVFFHEWYKHIYHANLKTHYGFLKYFMVTPQSHRIHHSVEPRHRDKNFGVIFSVWDRLFGTQYENYDEYPETGIADPQFPLEKGGGFSLLTTFFKQFLFPFKLIANPERLAVEVGQNV